MSSDFNIVFYVSFTYVDINVPVSRYQTKIMNIKVIT